MKEITNENPENQSLVSLISASVLDQIDVWIAKFPKEQAQSAILPAMLILQEYNGGWLSNELIKALADYLNIPAIAAYEVATFYSMYNLNPVGKYVFEVCQTGPCMLNGSDDILKYIKQKLNILKIMQESL